VEIVQVAQRIADEVLFPAALSTDASDIIPVELLDELARAGLYGLAAPREAGGLNADFGTVCAVLEALASGCLTTAFVFTQHTNLVRALAMGGNPELSAKWLALLARGEVRAGVALGGALPKPTLLARPDPDEPGWRLDGVSPFVSGWGRVDVVHAAARTPDGQIVWLLVDAVAGPSVRADRLRLAALNATATVRVTFDQLHVPADRVTGRHPARGGTAPEVLRTHAALALGVTARCCQLLGPTSLDEELVAARAKLDQLGPGTAAARGVAGELALRAAATLMATDGSRSLLVTEHGQRLAREAMFALVYALRPESRTAVLVTLSTPGPAATPGLPDPQGA
jgi:alkylation response protein AidB-like acyl-CoA dehydrogenase